MCYLLVSTVLSVKSSCSRFACSAIELNLASDIDHSNHAILKFWKSTKGRAQFTPVARMVVQQHHLDTCTLRTQLYFSCEHSFTFADVVCTLL